MSQSALMCDPDAVRAQLNRILACDDFDASERNKRFLTYVVEESLQGRADRIKAYTVATSVFGRDASFDPQEDAIVRIEAGRLRRSLEHYYLTSGRDDQIRIAIPIGSYAPSFLGSEESGAEATAPARSPDLETERARFPVIQVSSFEGEEELQVRPSPRPQHLAPCDRQPCTVHGSDGHCRQPAVPHESIGGTCGVRCAGRRFHSDGLCVKCGWSASRRGTAA